MKNFNATRSAVTAGVLAVPTIGVSAYLPTSGVVAVSAARIGAETEKAATSAVDFAAAAANPAAAPLVAAAPFAAAAAIPAAAPLSAKGQWSAAAIPAARHRRMNAMSVIENRYREKSR